MSELPTPSLPMEEAQPTIQETHVPGSSAPLHAPSLQTHAHKNTKRIILIGGTVLVACGTIAGLAYCAWAGYLPTPWTPRPNANDIIASLHDISSAGTTTTIHLAIEPQDSDVTQLDFSLFQKNGEEIINNNITNGILNMLPSDIALDLHIDALLEKPTEASSSTNTESHITGTYNANNIQADLDVTSRSIDNTLYVKLDALPLPLPLFNTQALKNTWINTASTNEFEVFASKNTYLHQKTEEAQKKESQAMEELFILLQEGIQNGTIIFSVPERITKNNARVWKSDVVIDGEKLRETIISIGEHRADFFEHTENLALFSDEFLTIIKKDRTKDIFKELFTRTTCTLTLKGKNQLDSLTFATRIAPNVDAFQTRQISLITNIQFTSINQDFVIEAPKDSITQEKAASLLLGQSEETFITDLQEKIISDLRIALELYKETYNTYPQQLTDLIGTESAKQTTIVINIPVDVMTKEPYGYSKREDGYALTYEIPNEEHDNQVSLIKTVPGTNTASELFFSEEAAKLQDRDGDGISAYDEQVRYGTSDKKIDSDNDGYDDRTEITAGYNPNGAGLLTNE